MKEGLSGFICVRNAISLDYCVGLAIQSLTPICDEIVVCDSDSNDGTRLLLDGIASRNEKVRIINRPWEEPVGKIDWWYTWLNWTRQHCSYDRMISLDADEVLAGDGDFNRDSCYWLIRRNFWRSAQFTIPDGRCCASRVARYGPTELEMCSDEMWTPDGAPGTLKGPEPELRKRAAIHPTRWIAHYGFLRKPEAMFSKCENNIRYFFGGTQDARLIEAQKHPEIHWTTFCQFDQPLVTYDGPHPEIAIEWLKERGAL